MPAYQLTILTPDGKIFDNPVEELVAPGAEGMFGVLAQHAPMVAALSKGVLKIKQNATEKFFAVEGGVLEVAPTHQVLVLVDQAQEAQSFMDAQQKLQSLGK